MNSPSSKHIPETSVKEQPVSYETPAIIYEGVISTRAGSPLSFETDWEDDLDPDNLFND